MNETRSDAVGARRIVTVLIALALGGAVLAAEHAGGHGTPVEMRGRLVAPEALASARTARVEALWRAEVQAVDAALAGGDVGGAIRAWHDAYGAAVASRGWEGMLAVGDAFVRIGAASGAPAASRPNARRAYLLALVRARRAGSTAGVGRTAEAFEALGDAAVAAQCRRLVAELTGDGRTRGREERHG